MAKYGKLDLSDDNDDEAIKSSNSPGINEALSVRRSAKYSVDFSDEKNDSSDLDSAPTTPVPKHLPRIKRAYSSKSRRIREAEHSDGGSFRDVQEVEETGPNVCQELHYYKKILTYRNAGFKSCGHTPYPAVGPISSLRISLKEQLYAFTRSCTRFFFEKTLQNISEQARRKSHD